MFGIVTISYGRPQVLKLFLASIKRLRAETGINFPVVVVGDAEHLDLCETYGVHHIAQTNHPATAKFNTGVNYLMGLGVDYVCIMGSDDIMSTNLLKNLIKEMNNGTDLIGISQIYFYSCDGKHRGHMRHLVTHGQYLGVARVVHRRIIEKVGKLWNREASWGMDGIALRNIAPYVKTKKIVEGIAVDCKSEFNLNKFSFWTTRITMNTPAKVFYEILSEEEKQILAEI